MSDTTTYTVTARLRPRSNTAALARIVSILHGRGASVRHLSFDADGEHRASVTAHIVLDNTSWATLQESLRRPVEVLEVSGRAAPRIGFAPADDPSGALAMCGLAAAAPRASTASRKGSAPPGRC